MIGMGFAKITVATKEVGVWGLVPTNNKNNKIIFDKIYLFQYILKLIISNMQVKFLQTVKIIFI